MSTCRQAGRGPATPISWETNDIGWRWGSVPGRPDRFFVYFNAGTGRWHANDYATDVQAACGSEAAGRWVNGESEAGDGPDEPHPAELVAERVVRNADAIDLGFLAAEGL